MNEIIFQIMQDDVDGGYCASALNYSIHTEADTLDDLRVNIREAVACHFDEKEDAPKLVRLHFVHDEVLAL